MKNKYVFIIMVLFLLNSCGIGFFGIGTGNSIYKNDADIKFKKNTCMSIDGGFMSFGCSQYLLKEKKMEEISVKEKIDKIDISLQTLNNGKVKVLSFGILPLIPAPPIIPTFFFPAMGHKEFCGGESYKVELVFESKNNDLDNIEIDLRNIYLLKNDKKNICK